MYTFSQEKGRAIAFEGSLFKAFETRFHLSLGPVVSSLACGVRIKWALYPAEVPVLSETQVIVFLPCD